MRRLTIASALNVMPNSRWRAALCGLLFALAGVSASAEWIGMNLKPMPVDRLVKNLEARISKEPSNANLRANLARLHAYAFATKAATVFEREGFAAVPDFESDLPAQQITPPDSPEQGTQARRHLDRAIERYREALRLERSHLVARLGLAWCLEQAGRKPDAISEYRTLLDLAWKQERAAARNRDSRFKPYVTEEAGTRLIALLPGDALDEIRDIQQRITEVSAQSVRAITPLVVPLDSSWSPERGLSRRAAFDADGTGVPKTWSWIDRGAAWLVYDNAAGDIDTALQLFGSVTFWLFWENGYEALCALDDTGDGVLAGRELDRLALWHDVNENGRSEPGEVSPLARYDITALSCGQVVTTDEESSVAAYVVDGVRFANGSFRPTYDVILHAAESTR